MFSAVIFNILFRLGKNKANIRLKIRALNNNLFILYALNICKHIAIPNNIIDIVNCSYITVIISIKNYMIYIILFFVPLLKILLPIIENIMNTNPYAKPKLPIKLTLT